MPIDDHGFFAGGRSSAPATWRSDDRPPGNISRAFHHVIPLRDLSDTWQGLRRGLRPGQRGPFFWAIDKYMSMLGVAGNRQKKIEQMMKDEGFVDQLYVKEDISSKLDWPAWDIVEGPANRADDPGSGFDQFLYGMTPEEKMRQSDIHLLYEAMDAFLRRYRSLEAYPYPLSDPRSKGYTDAERNDPDYRRLVEALVRPMGFIGTKYSRAGYIPYKASMWKAVEKRTVSPTNREAWEREPRFRKADQKPSSVFPSGDPTSSARQHQIRKMGQR